MSGAFHTIGPGDSTTKLAFERGFFPDTIWNHAENSDLRSKREDLNILMPGDELFLPDKEVKEVDAPTEQKHRFRRKGVPEKLRVQFFDLHHKPLANKPYLLKLDGNPTRGTLDGDGVLDVSIPPDAQVATVEVGTNGSLAKATLSLGHLDPIGEISGVQMRLKNLGFFTGAVDGKGSDDLDSAIKRFRAAQGLDEKVDLDQEVRDKLKSVYGA